MVDLALVNKMLITVVFALLIFGLIYLIREK